MFSTLFDKIFPALGAIFGFFSSMATMPYKDFIEFLFVVPAEWEGLFYLSCTNVFNGSTFEIPSIGSVLHEFIWDITVNQPLLGPNIVVQAFADAVLSGASDILHGVLTNLWSMMLSPMGLTLNSQTWVCMLALSPVFAIGVGLLKLLWDMIPIF